MHILLKDVYTKDDVDLIKSFYHDVFPEEPKYDCIDFTNSITGNHNYKFFKYFTVYSEDVGEECIGFCGIYAANYEEAWLGWFGVKPKFRRRGFGKEMLSELEFLMLQYGYRYSRLYTDKVINNNAYNLYLKNGYIEDSQYEYNFVTMIKDLTGMKVTEDKYWKEKTPLGFESEPPHHAV